MPEAKNKFRKVRWENEEKIRRQTYNLSIEEVLAIEASRGRYTQIPGKEVAWFKKNARLMQFYVECGI